MPDSIPIVGKLIGLTGQNPLILAIFLWHTLCNPILTTAIQPLFIALNIYTTQDVIKPKQDFLPPDASVVMSHHGVLIERDFIDSVILKG